MKRISIIIPITKTTLGTDVKTFAASTITDAFSNIYHDLCKSAIEFEIIIVSDSTTSITLEDIQIFPIFTQIRFFKEESPKKLSELVSRGVSLAHFEYIGILGSTVGYMPNVFKNILSQVGNDNDIIAAINPSPLLRLPFLFRLVLHKTNATILFKKSVWDVIKFQPVNDNAFLYEFFKRAQEAGFTVKKFQFANEANYQTIDTPPSFKRVIKASKDFLTFSTMKMSPVYIPAQSSNTMINAGIFYKKQQYITHTTLKAYNSALEMFDKRNFFFVAAVIFFLIGAFIYNPLFFTQCFIAVLSLIYLADVGFNMFLVLKSFRNSPELSFTSKELRAIDDKKLPVYSILCPLYKEVHILPQFIKGLEKLDWPKDKLDVIVLLESDDTESIRLMQEKKLPSYIRPIVVPNSIPKTKPKACNYGLNFAKGAYTVIYDAEDIPDPLQLKKAYLGFEQSDDKLACLQAKLNYYNVHQNLLTRFFTAEYSLWFDVTLTGLNSLNTIIPLGGTSNHFRTKDLRKLHAWDPFNVTEDADLGMRLFKGGYRTAILDSVTLEEGNSNVKNWIRQRSRWIKGYMQTYLVHTKESFSFFRKRGVHALIFQLVIGGKIAFIIINPFLWIVTLLYFGIYPIVGPTIDTFYPPFVLYVAITSLIFGNYFYLFCHLMGCIKKEQWALIKYVYLIPLYWILISIAGFMAFYQLIFKPFYWEKTVHGLHLKNNLSIS